MNVSDTAAKPVVETIKRHAMDKAVEIAGSEGLPSPTLIYESGHPEIRIIMSDGGRDTRVYFRNSEITPIVTIADLDYEEDTEDELRKAVAELEAGGFTFMPHMVPDYGG